MTETARRGEADGRGAGGRAEDAVRHRIWLSGGRDAAAGARAALDLITVEQFDETACEALRLMVSELVANSVLHGGAVGMEDDIELVVVLSAAVVRVECRDPAGGFDPPPLPTEPVRSSGYGLAIVDALASRWGADMGGVGGTWFEFDRV